MDEEKKMTLESLQQGLIDQIGSGELDDVSCVAVRDMFDSVSKALAEQRKAENEKLRIDAETARAAQEAETDRLKIEADTRRAIRDAEVADQRSKRELIGNGIRAAAQVLGGLFAGAASIGGILIIRNEELSDRLVNSKALSFIIKPRS